MNPLYQCDGTDVRDQVDGHVHFRQRYCHPVQSIVRDGTVCQRKVVHAKLYRINVYLLGCVCLILYGCVRMYVCVCVCMYVCMCVYVYMYIYMYTYVCVWLYIYIYIYICVCVVVSYIYIYICMYVCVSVLHNMYFHIIPTDPSWISSTDVQILQLHMFATNGHKYNAVVLEMS